MNMKKAAARLKSLANWEPEEKEFIDEAEVAELEQEAAAPEPRVAIDEAVLARLRTLTKEQQVVEDADISEGVAHLFENAYLRAEELFAQRAGHEPLAALAHAAVALIRGLLSFSKDDLEIAAQRLILAERLANTVYPEDGYLSSFSRMVRLKGRKKATNPQLRATMVKALANALLAVTMVVQESVQQLVRGGLALRKAYSKLAECESDMASGIEPYDDNCVGSIHLALGMVNIALSTVPQKVLKLIALLGYPCDRAKGFQLLERAVATDSFATPFAQLTLVVHRGVIPGVAPILIPSELPKALAILEEARAKYPRSCIHAHLAGRLARIQRDTVGARAHFEMALAEQKELPQLKHVVIYDLAWNDYLELNFEQAAERFGFLLEENKWSKCFCRYLEGTALEMAGHKARAVECYKAAPALSTKKFGGKRIPQEQFVLRKVAMFEEDGWDTILPGLELMVLSNMYTQMAPAAVAHFLALADARLAALTATGEQSPDRLAVIWLLTACLHKELGHFDEAAGLFRKIYDISDDIEGNTFAVPYALFEHGCMLAVKGNEEESLERLKEAHSMLMTAKEDYKDYNFEVRLEFKLLLTLPLVTEWLAAAKARAPPQK